MICCMESSVRDNPVYHALILPCLEHGSSGVLHTTVLGNAAPMIVTLDAPAWTDIDYYILLFIGKNLSGLRQFDHVLMRKARLKTQL